MIRYLGLFLIFIDLLLTFNIAIMKSIKTIIFLIFLAFILNGCDELIKKDIDVPITIRLVERVTIPEDSDEDAKNVFSAGGKYDILSHPDIANVIGTPDKIKKVKITKIKYGYTNFKGNVDAIISGVIGLPTNSGSGYLGSFIEAYFEIKPVNVAESALLSNQYTLNGDYSKVNEYVTNNVELQYAIMGNATKNPAIFDVVFNITATVTVEASIDFEGNYN